MRNKLTTLLKIVVSIVLILIVFSRVPLAVVGVLLATANPWFVPAAFALDELAITVNAAKWQVLLRAEQVVIPFGPLLEFQFVGFFYNFCPPTSAAT